MKHEITRIEIKYVRNQAGLNVQDQEFESLPKAAAFLWQHKPKTTLEIPVDVCAIIHWDDGTSCGEMWKMTSDPNSIHNPRWAIWNKMAFFAGIYRPTGMTEEQHKVSLEINALDGNIEELQRACLMWLLQYDLQLGFGHGLTAEELADLPDKWENCTVDTIRYYQAVIRAWRVPKNIYDHMKSLGALCQEHNGKYYIA
jgi:hypothetical protein